MNGKENTFKFQGKIIITADIRCITGLHIGGTDEGFEIGGVDNTVIKDPLTGIPYIPGSSLKGKMRSLLEWADKSSHNEKSCVEFQIEKLSNENKSQQVIKEATKRSTFSVKPCDCGECDVCIIFGSSAASSSNNGPTRLIVRDAFPKGFLNDDCGRNFDSEQLGRWQKVLGEHIYTELKTENTIDRLTSQANPRTIERVPADSVFTVEMIFDIYTDEDRKRLKKVFQAMALLEDNYLGGGGSRGSGKIKFENIKIYERDLNYYCSVNKKDVSEDNEKVISDGNMLVKQIIEKFEEIFKK